MNFKRGKLMDVHGVVVPWVSMNALGKEDKVAVKQLGKEVFAAMSGLSLILPLYAWGILPFAAYGIFWLTSGSTTFSTSQHIWINITILLLFALSWNRVRYTWRRWWATGLLRIGRCPSCGYVLSECEPRDDGRVVCPECGSHWELDESHCKQKP